MGDERTISKGIRKSSVIQGKKMEERSPKHFPVSEEQNGGTMEKGRRFFATMLIVLVLLSAAVPLFAAIPVVSGEEVQRETAPLHLNLKKEDKFSPETEQDSNHTGEVRHVTANHDQIGNLIYNVDWEEVGTWTSDDLAGDLSAEGQVQFNIWYQVTENVNNNNVDWEFRLSYNDEDVCYAKLENANQDTDRPIEVSVQGTLNRTITASSGDSFSVYIRYRSAADCDVYYDSRNYDSGASILSDPVIVFNGKRSGSDVSSEFYDAFGINWERNGKYFCRIEIDGEGGYGDDFTETEQGGEKPGPNGTTKYSTTRIIFKDVPSGKSVTITIAYGVMDNSTSGSWSFTFTGKGGGNGGGSNDDSDDDNTMLFAGGGIGAAVVVVGLVLFRKKRGGSEKEEDYDEDEGWDEEDEDYDEDDEMDYGE